MLQDGQMLDPRTQNIVWLTCIKNEKDFIIIIIIIALQCMVYTCWIQVSLLLRHAIYVLGSIKN